MNSYILQRKKCFDCIRFLRLDVLNRTTENTEQGNQFAFIFMHKNSTNSYFSTAPN